MKTPTSIGRFSNFTTEEIFLAKKMARTFLFRQQAFYYPFRTFKHDGRCRIDVLANYYVHDLIYNKKIDLRAIHELQKKRRQNKFNSQQKNVYQNKLVIDYFKNFSDIKYIDKSVILFYTRNHWAKNAHDSKILEILKKHFIQKTNK